MAVSGGAKAENPRVDGTDARFHALVSQRQRNTLEERDSEGSNPSQRTSRQGAMRVGRRLGVDRNVSPS